MKFSIKTTLLVLTLIAVGLALYILVDPSGREEVGRIRKAAKFMNTHGEFRSTFKGFYWDLSDVPKITLSELKLIDDLDDLDRSKIRELNLSGTHVSDEYLEYIATISSLERIDLRGTRVTKVGVSKLRGNPSFADTTILSDFDAHQDEDGEDETEFKSLFEIEDVHESVPKPLRDLFSKQTTVFGVQILATNTTPDLKLQHATNVLAQYFDNDEDGEPDNPLVIEAMQDNRATLVMFATDREAEQIIEQIEESENVADIFDSMILQDLYGSETHPDGASRGEFDASYEEVLHLITHAGYAVAYPDVFGEKPGTKLADAMDVARGGQFFEIPDKYPDEAWYTYDDETCGYSCQAAEYIYWGLTSMLGAQEFEGRGEEIANEWKLNTPEKFKEGDVLLYQLLSDPQYKWPTRLPDGRYRVKTKEGKQSD